MLITYYTAISAVTFLAWGLDKRRAKARRWRIPERELLTLILFGGAFGALLGMMLFRHKTRKPKFWTLAVAGSVIHAAVIYISHIL